MHNPPMDHTLRLEISMSAAADEISDLQPDITAWHAWVEYFLYCLEEHALFLERHPAFDAELRQVGAAIQRRLEQGHWET